MFAYCGNNPINLSDYSGALPGYAFLGDNHIFSDKYLMGGAGGGGLITASSRAASTKVIEDEIDYFNNTSEEVVLEAEDVAFYKGALVIKVRAMDNSAFSFGIILMGPNVDAETVKHEYGHYVHLRQIGLHSYTTNVAIPSLVDYWSGLPYELYFSEPQEYIADMLGGVSRTINNVPYTYNISPVEAILYYIYTLVY